MTKLLHLLLIILAVQANRLIDKFETKSTGYTASSTNTAVCIKTWSIRVNQWLFLGETGTLSETCDTKWYINTQFALCNTPGQCFSIKSATSNLYLSNIIGKLTYVLSENEMWNLLATPPGSNQRSILLNNHFLDSNNYFDTLLCSDINQMLTFKSDDKIRFCHWIIDEIITIEPTPKPIDNDNKCSIDHRHRRPWYSLTNNERELFISAVKELNANGQLHTLVAVHANFSANVQAHFCASFGPFHRYHLWEFENAVRNLGGKYKCFSLPYWDITREALETRNPFEWFILNSGLGSNGNPDDEWCVDDDIFGQYSEYKPYLHCIVNEELEPINTYTYDANIQKPKAKCCLKRNVCEKECVIYTPTDIIHSIVALPEYGTDEHQKISDPTLPPSQPLLRKYAPETAGFMYDLEHKHGSFHSIIGGNNGMLNDLHFSPDEPIFWLMHNFIDYIWALWQDCHDYDLVNEEDINEKIYGGVLGKPDNIIQLHGPSRLDDELLLKELKETDWSYVSYHNDIVLTPRDLHNINRWKYSFEKGIFWQNARVDKFCENINEKWFYQQHY
eukprot:532973_1